MDNPFYLDKDEYVRDYDVIGNAVTNIATYIHHRLPQFSRDVITEFVKKKIKNDVKLISPKMKVLRRQPRGDRHRAQIDFINYLKWVEKNKHGMTPNMVCYANPDLERSYLSDFIEEKLKSRSVKKKLAAKYKALKDDVQSTFYNLGQNNDKIAINSLSGALSVPYNFIYLGSGHSGLTSTCRAVTSYANAINEKLLAGSRHYFNPEVTKEDLAFLARKVNLDRLAVVMEKYKMHIPTPDEVFEHVLRSTRRYWSGEEEQNIYKQIQGMTGIERAAVLYVGDLYALAEYDDITLRQIYMKLLRKVDSLPTIEEADMVTESADADQVALTGLLCIDFMKGIPAKDIKEKDPDLYRQYAARLKNVSETFIEYRDFIKAFWSMDFLPGQIHSITTINRQAVAASDTDSDIFSSMYQIEWFCGDIGNRYEHVACTAVTTYLSSQIIAHSLGILCANMGVEEQKLFRLTMKNEFYFPIMLVTTRTKHYMALIAAKEGFVYDKNEVEVKGVALRGSKIAKAIAKDSEETFTQLLEFTINNIGGMNPYQVMAVPAYIEHRIIPALEAGEVWPLNAARVNKKEGYKNPERADYFQYMAWNAIFGEKYGYVELLPSAFVKVPVTLKSRKVIDQWIQTLEPDMAKRATEFYNHYEKKKVTNFFVPIELLPNGRIPKEIVDVIDVRRHIAQTMQRFYMMMEGYGLFFTEPKNRTLVSDIMTLEQCLEHSPIDVSKLQVNQATDINLDYLDEYYFEEDEDEVEESDDD